ncbi:MAG TPA: Crp/Fnr family transcriptional regulator [Tenuifilaceae bacterium]|nr:Crp/Fnr family transcriptional regulator [Tenuifilaceae bacterium]HPQ33045.1 Crp/Fnr family transcriptional regulator [Tenuifilaceae bacterium]
MAELIWLKSVLNPAELELLEKKSTVVHYTKRDVIIKKGEFITNVMIILNGFVKVETEEGGNTFIIDIIPAVNMIGIPIFLGSTKHRYSITALSQVTIQFFPIQFFLSTLEQNGRAAMSLMEYSNKRVVTPLIEKLSYMNRNSIRERLAKLLLHFSKDIHKQASFTLLLSRHEIASMIGFSRENVIRMLSEFNSNGIIRLKGKSILILDLKRLEELAGNSK